MDKIKSLIKQFKNVIGKGEDEETADKRARIVRAQQQMMLAVAGASVVFGICLVLSIHFVQYIVFYGKVLSEEDKSISNYEQSILNSGACIDGNGDKSLSSAEVDACTPGQASLSQVSGKLRSNILVNMAQNTDLESVGREYVSECRDPDTKKPIDFVSQYERSTTDEDREKYLALIKVCSSLRVIPDALPAQRNEEALMASLNQVFLDAGWLPESLSPGDSGGSDEGVTLGELPVTLAVEGDASITSNVLHSVERSIRTFNPTRAMISWSTSGLSMQTNATAYYTTGAGFNEKDKTINASTGR